MKMGRGGSGCGEAFHKKSSKSTRDDDKGLGQRGRVFQSPRGLPPVSELSRTWGCLGYARYFARLARRLRSGL